MGTHRVMVTFENVSGKPEDRFVNTWHVGTGGGITSDALELMATSFQDFYRGPGGTGGVMSYMSPVVANGPLHSIKFYDLAEPMPRPAKNVRWFSPPSAPSGTPLPNEVALCLSMYATRNLKRQRGRVYLGPFKTSAVEGTTASHDGRPAAAMLTAISVRAQTLVNELAGALVVRSPSDGVARPVTHLWLDNAWDTQRRRGAKSTARTVVERSGGGS